MSDVTFRPSIEQSVKTIDVSSGTKCHVYQKERLFDKTSRLSQRSFLKFNIKYRMQDNVWQGDETILITAVTSLPRWVSIGMLI